MCIAYWPQNGSNAVICRTDLGREYSRKLEQLRREEELIQEEELEAEALQKVDVNIAEEVILPIKAMLLVYLYGLYHQMPQVFVSSDPFSIMSMPIMREKTSQPLSEEAESTVKVFSNCHSLSLLLTIEHLNGHDRPQ